jgi:hypothetical protein
MKNTQHVVQPSEQTLRISQHINSTRTKAWEGSPAQACGTCVLFTQNETVQPKDRSPTSGENNQTDTPQFVSKKSKKRTLPYTLIFPKTEKRHLFL